jgi:hypothetical protein
MEKVKMKRERAHVMEKLEALKSEFRTATSEKRPRIWRKQRWREEQHIL